MSLSQIQRQNRKQFPPEQASYSAIVSKVCTRVRVAESEMEGTYPDRIKQTVYSRR